MNNSQAILLAIAYVAGKFAGASRERFSTNPHEAGTEERHEWARGWREGVAETLARARAA